MTTALHTDRLLIRKPKLSDASACAAHLNNIEISKWLGVVPFPYTEQDAVEFITEYTGDFPQSAFIFDGGTLVGGIGISKELGYWLAPEAWGKGYATEAATALIDFYFAQNNVDHILSGYHSGNVRSKNVLVKLGFKPSGARTNVPRSTGKETLLFEVTLTRSDWEARNATN